MDRFRILFLPPRDRRRSKWQSCDLVYSSGLETLFISVVASRPSVPAWMQCPHLSRYAPASCRLREDVLRVLPYPASSLGCHLSYLAIRMPLMAATFLRNRFPRESDACICGSVPRVPAASVRARALSKFKLMRMRTDPLDYPKQITPIYSLGIPLVQHKPASVHNKKYTNPKMQMHKYKNADEVKA